MYDVKSGAEGKGSVNKVKRSIRARAASCRILSGPVTLFLRLGTPPHPESIVSIPLLDGSLLGDTADNESEAVEDMFPSPIEDDVGCAECSRCKDVGGTLPRGLLSCLPISISGRVVIVTLLSPPIRCVLSSAARVGVSFSVPESDSGAESWSLRLDPISI